MDTFITDLRRLATSCKFADSKVDKLIRDKLVFGVTDVSLQEELLKTKDLDLAKAGDILRAAEVARKQRQEMVKRVDVQAISKPSHNQRNCGYCGSVHNKGKCPAYGRKCAKCGRINHFSKVCRSAGSQKEAMPVHNVQGEVNVQSIQEERESDQEFFIGALVGDQKMHWLVNVDINGVKRIRCKVDTGR